MMGLYMYFYCKTVAQITLIMFKIIMKIALMVMYLAAIFVISF